MNVYLSENGEQLPTDVVIRWANRSDLSPTPRNLEFTVKLIKGVENRLTKGTVIWSGRENLAYKILKVAKAAPLGEVQGKDQQQAMNVIAVLDSCSALSDPRAQAVVMRGQPFSAALRSCGAYLRIDPQSDFIVPRFTCLRGSIPSFGLNTVLQEEGAAMVLANGKLKLMRLTDIAKQAPIDDIGQVDTSATISSEFLELMQIPSFYSVDDTGAIVTGQMGDSRVISFMPRGDARQLRNASCVLVRAKTVDSQQCQQIQAGHVLTVGGKNLVVITAAHAAIQKTGAMESYSRLWLGELVNAA